MAGPTVIGGTPNQGMESLKAGIEQIAQLGKFLEQKRQFEVEQERLNNIQTANWGWSAIQELVKTTDSQSVKDVALNYPGMLSFIMQKGLPGADKNDIMSWITALGKSSDNGPEAMNRAFALHTRLGNGETDAKTELNQSTQEMMKAYEAAQVAAGGTATTKTPPQEGQPPVGTETGVAKSEPITNAPPPGEGYLGDLKASLYRFIKGFRPGAKIAYQNMTTYRGLIDTYAQLYPGDADKFKDFQKNDLQTFIRDVQEGKWSPPIAPAGTVGAPGSPNPPSPPLPIKEAFEPGSSMAKPPYMEQAPGKATPVFQGDPRNDPQVLKKFAQYLYDNKLGDKPLSRPPDQMRPETIAGLPDTNQAAWNSFIGGKAPTTAVPQTPPNPEAVAAVQSLMRAMASGGGGAGQVVLKGKKLTKALGPELAAQLEKTPEGVKQLIDNSNWLLNDPTSLRAMAMQQNAAAVYATDLRESGSTVLSKMEMAKLEKEAKKLDLEVEKAGIDVTMAALTLSMVKSGMLPPSLQGTFMELTKGVSSEWVLYTKAKAAQDKDAAETHLANHNTFRNQLGKMMSSFSAALGEQNSAEAKKWKAAVDLVRQYQSAGKALWGIGWELPFSWGTTPLVSEGGQAESSSTKPTMSTAGAAFDQEVNSEVQ